MNLLKGPRLTRLAHAVCITTIAWLILSFVPEHSTYATTSCSGFTYSFDGAERGGTVYGASAVISSGNGGLCGTDHSDSSVWSMVAGSSSLQYAQAGYGRSVGQSNSLYFAEYNNNFSSPVDVYGSAIDANRHTYWERYDYDYGTEGMYVDNTLYEQTNFDPTASWSTIVPEFFGETHDHGDDMPGTSFIPVTLTGLATQNSSRSSTFSSVTGLSSYNSYSTRYAENLNGTSLSIWTK